MKRMVLAALAVLSVSGVFAAPALADDLGGRADAQFIGIDLDNGSVYYNGHNSGRYCVYRTVEQYDRFTGYLEDVRVRNCGRGLYIR